MYEVRHVNVETGIEICVRQFRNKQFALLSAEALNTTHNVKKTVTPGTYGPITTYSSDHYTVVCC